MHCAVDATYGLYGREALWVFPLRSSHLSPNRTAPNLWRDELGLFETHTGIEHTVVRWLRRSYDL